MNTSGSAAEVAHLALALAGDALVALGAGDGEVIPHEPSVFATNFTLHTPVKSHDRSRQGIVEPSCVGTSVHSTQLLVPQVPEFVLCSLHPVPPVASAPPGPQVDDGSDEAYDRRGFGS